MKNLTSTLGNLATGKFVNGLKNLRLYIGIVKRMCNKLRRLKTCECIHFRTSYYIMTTVRQHTKITTLLNQNFN